MISLKQLAEFYQVKVKIVSLPDRWEGRYNVRNQVIEISNTSRSKLSVFFHELGHHFCKRNNIWPSYHQTGVRSRRQIKKLIRTAYKAECWVDKWAEFQMAIWFPHLKYRRGYDSEEARVWLHTNYLSYYKSFL